MESWRGTFMGMSWSAFSNVPALFKAAFGAYNATALAIAGAALGIHTLLVCRVLMHMPLSASSG